MITVTLTASVPIKTTCLKDHALTIHGISDMLPTFNGLNANLEGTTGIWDENDGTMIVTPGADLAAGVDLELNWTLVHTQDVAATRAVNVTATAVSPKDQATSLSLDCQLGVLTIDPIAWTISMTQSPPLACTVNQVTICISTSQPLINVVPNGDVSGCSAGAAYCTNWCQNTYQLTGLINMATPDSIELPVTNLNGSTPVFFGAAEWSQEAGTLVVRYKNNTIANTKYCFRVLLAYPNCSTTSTTPVPTTSSTTSAPTTSRCIFMPSRRVTVLIVTCYDVSV